MENNANGGKPFYVVQFIEIPFEGIDDYVCVPYSWVIIRRLTDRKVVVAYPTNEDPFVTRDRVKRKERYNDEWRFYMAEIKYESEMKSTRLQAFCAHCGKGPVPRSSIHRSKSLPNLVTSNVPKKKKELWSRRDSI